MGNSILNYHFIVIALFIVRESIVQWRNHNIYQDINKMFLTAIVIRACDKSTPLN